jgi:hypothetical protein
MAKFEFDLVHLFLVSFVRQLVVMGALMLDQVAYLLIAFQLLLAEFDGLGLERDLALRAVLVGAPEGFSVLLEDLVVGCGVSHFKGVGVLGADLR